MSVDFVGRKNVDGTNFGQVGSKIGFYGLATPIVKPSITDVTTATATTTLNELRIARIMAALEALGLVVTAAP